MDKLMDITLENVSVRDIETIAKALSLYIECFNGTEQSIEETDSLQTMFEDLSKNLRAYERNKKTAEVVETATVVRLIQPEDNVIRLSDRK